MRVFIAAVFFKFVLLLQLIHVVSGFCAYGGDGTLNSYGVALINPTPHTSPDSGGVSIILPANVGLSARHKFSSVFFGDGSSPNDSKAGWMIQTASTTGLQKLWVWSNMTGTTPPFCVGQTSTAGKPFLSTFGVCAGSPGSLWPTLIRSYSIGNMPVSVFEQVGNFTRMVLADQSVPISNYGQTSPLSSGAFSINFERGSADEPPAVYGIAPSYCH